MTVPTPTSGRHCASQHASALGPDSSSVADKPPHVSEQLTLLMVRPFGWVTRG